MAMTTATAKVVARGEGDVLAYLVLEGPHHGIAFRASDKPTLGTKVTITYDPDDQFARTLRRDVYVFVMEDDFDDAGSICSASITGDVIGIWAYNTHAEAIAALSNGEIGDVILKIDANPDELGTETITGGMCWNGRASADRLTRCGTPPEASVPADREHLLYAVLAQIEDCGRDEKIIILQQAIDLIRKES